MPLTPGVSHGYRACTAVTGVALSSMGIIVSAGYEVNLVVPTFRFGDLSGCARCRRVGGLDRVAERHVRRKAPIGLEVLGVISV